MKGDEMDKQTAEDKVVVTACKYVHAKKAKIGTQGKAREVAQSRVVESERNLAEAVEKLEKGWPTESATAPDQST